MLLSCRIDIQGLDEASKQAIVENGFTGWLDKSDKPQKKITREQALVTATRLCALGPKCMKAQDRRGFPVAGNGLYCSDNCRGRAKVLARKAAQAKTEAYLPTIQKLAWFADRGARLRIGGDQNLRKRKSLAFPSTFSRIGCGSMRAISTAPISVEKIAKKACSLSTVRRPGMNGSIWLL